MYQDTSLRMRELIQAQHLRVLIRFILHFQQKAHSLLMVSQTISRNHFDTANSVTRIFFPYYSPMVNNLLPLSGNMVQ